jgi:hypothetical protein
MEVRDIDISDLAERLEDERDIYARIPSSFKKEGNEFNKFYHSEPRQPIDKHKKYVPPKKRFGKD